MSGFRYNYFKNISLSFGEGQGEVEIMQNPRLASRYAKSLLDLAVERNCLEEVLRDMQMFNHICTISHDFDVVLRSPVIKGDKKVAVINAVMKGNIHLVTKSFISLLVTKGRELNLGEIAAAFIDQYKLLKNIRTVRLKTAVPMDDTMKQALLSKISGFMEGHTIDLKTSVDEELMGGFVLEVEDQLFDASVKKKLNDIKTSIVDYSYVSRM